MHKNKNHLGKNYIFVFGFPGSGTTIFSEQLSKNLESVLWLEPYFVWRKNLKNKYFDNFKLKDLNETAINQIRADFHYFYTKSKKKFLIEKEPRNILNFLIIKKIFPYSKFIFIKKKKFKNNFKTIERKTNSRKKKFIIFDIKDFIIKLKQQKFVKFMFSLIIYELKNIDRISEYFKKYSKIGKVTWGIKLKLNNKIFYLDNIKKFKLLEEMQKAKLKKLNNKDYIVISLEKLAKNFKMEYKKVIKFIGKDNFINYNVILNKKRILKPN